MYDSTFEDQLITIQHNQNIEAFFDEFGDVLELNITSIDHDLDLCKATEANELLETGEVKSLNDTYDFYHSVFEYRDRIMLMTKSL